MVLQCTRLFNYYIPKQSILVGNQDSLCTSEQADPQMGIFHPGESGCPPLVVGGYSHTPADSLRPQPRS